MPEKLTFNAIIPVFNEELTVKKLVQTVVKSRLFDQIIVINDASKDASLAILKRFPSSQIKLITHKHNKGKGCALATGIKQASGDIVVFLDADSVNMTKKRLNYILKPFSNPKIKVVVASTKYVVDRLSFLQGERAYYRADLLPYLERMKCTRFGVELFLERLRKEKKWHTHHAQISGLKKLIKFDKTGISAQTMKAYLFEVAEIVNEAARDQTKTAREIYILQKNITSWMIEDYLKIPKKMIKSIVKQSKKLKVLTRFLNNP